jgi:hypothetical protein
VLPVFKCLLTDSSPEVRANCALVMPRMIQLVGSDFANILFDDILFSVMAEKNPLVIVKMLSQIELAVRATTKKSGEK